MTQLVHIFTVAQSLKFLSGQPAFMRSHGWESTVVTSPDPALNAFGDDEGVEAVAIEMPRRITPLQDLASVVRLALFLLRKKPDLVHAHTPKGGLLGMLAGTIACVPNRIYHMRGLPFMTATGLSRRLLMTTERISCLLAHRVLCVSNSLRHEALKERIVCADKIHVLGYGSGQGVDARTRFNRDQYDPSLASELRKARGIPANATVIGFVGRLVHDKGISDLVEAWRQLRVKHPNTWLWLIGPLEPQDPVAPEHLAMLEEDERVVMEGYVSDPAPLYLAMDVLTLPSHREGFPNVPLEAASMMLPVVATRIPGCVDAIDEGTTGKLVPVADPEALAKALSAYIESSDLRALHGQRGRTRVLLHFEREVIWKEIASAYEEVMARRDLAQDLLDRLTIPS